ncbi:MAG: hypothetical protein U5K76_15485 [Woeseiaceae bacterium]|nr:hypothetical protein [Woeseiaceae bacterium]
MTIRIPLFIVLFLATIATAAGIPNRPTQDAESPRSDFADALAQQNFDEAVVIAKARLAGALDAGRRHQLETAALYIDLADAQRLNADPQAAQANYEAAIDIVESQADMLNIALERPLFGLGHAMLDQNRPDLAVLPLERAVHVRQVNDGPHDANQIDTLHALATAFLRLGDVSQAGLIADRIGYLFSRNRADADLDIVQTAVRLGTIYRNLFRYEDERSTYYSAITFAKESARFPVSSMVEPHVRIAQSYSHEYFELYFGASEPDDLPSKELLDMARSFHEQAVEIAGQSNSNWQQQYRAQLALGDFYIMTDNFADARTAYRDSWQLLTADPARHDRRRTDMESAVPLLQPQLDNMIDSESSDRSSRRP